MHQQQLREYVIRPVLKHIGAYSQAAEEMLILTAAHESRGGHYLHQVGGGPAVGIFQMEPATHDDIWRNYLEYKDELTDRVNHFRVIAYEFDPDSDFDADEMAGNLYYAAAMARVHYLRVPEALPAADDIDGLAAYYKAHYNTPDGSATVAQAIAHYQDFVA